MERLKETQNIDKVFIDASPLGLTITIDASAGTGGREPSIIAESILELVERVQSAQPPLVLWPLRYILVAANLAAAVNVWNRARIPGGRRLEWGCRQAYLMGQ